MKNYQVIGIITAILAAVVGYFQLSYEKYLAEWGGVNIYLYALPIAALSAWGIYELIRKFVMDGEYRFPGWLSGIVAVGVCLSMWLGIEFTEPKAKYGWDEQNTKISHNERHHYSTSYHWFHSSSGSSYSSGSSSSSSSDWGDAGEGIVILGVIIVVLSHILLSIFIAHYWVVGSISLITLLIFIAVNEWKHES